MAREVEPKVLRANFSPASFLQARASLVSCSNGFMVQQLAVIQSHRHAHIAQSLLRQIAGFLATIGNEIAH